MNDQDRANKFLERLVTKAVVRKHELTPDRTKPTNLTPERKQRIADNQIRQRNINQQEKSPLYGGHTERLLSAVNADTETKKKVASNVAGKRDPWVVSEYQYGPVSEVRSTPPPPRSQFLSRNELHRRVMRPASKRERLRALAYNTERHAIGAGTLEPEDALHVLQRKLGRLEVRHGIPTPKRRFYRRGGGHNVDYVD